MSFAGSTLAAAGALLAGYAFLVRPKLVRWGATDEEVRRPFPGADVVPGGDRGTTMAVTIEAPPSAVWPWLVQMGVDRAIWYTWDYWRPWGLRSADRIHPEWQTVSIGHHMPSVPSGRVWWEVAARGLVSFFMLEPSTWLMQTRQFSGLKRRAERSRPTTTQASRPAA